MFSDKITKLVAEDVKKIVGGRVKQSAEQGAMVNSGTPEPVDKNSQSTSNTEKPLRPVKTKAANNVVVMGGQGRGDLTGQDITNMLGKSGDTRKKVGGAITRVFQSIKSIARK